VPFPLLLRISSAAEELPAGAGAGAAGAAGAGLATAKVVAAVAGASLVVGGGAVLEHRQGGGDHHRAIPVHVAPAHDATASAKAETVHAPAATPTPVASTRPVGDVVRRRHRRRAPTASTTPVAASPLRTPHPTAGGEGRHGDDGSGDDTRRQGTTPGRHDGSGDDGSGSGSPTTTAGDDATQPTQGVSPTDSGGGGGDDGGPSSPDLSEQSSSGRDGTDGSSTTLPTATSDD
jgi:hypothetical protein